MAKPFRSAIHPLAAVLQDELTRLQEHVGSVEQERTAACPVEDAETSAKIQNIREGIRAVTHQG